MRGLQRNWDPDYLEDGWPRGLDNFFLVDRINSVAMQATMDGTGLLFISHPNRR